MSCIFSVDARTHQRACFTNLCYCERNE